jgi:serine/threonine protein kinase
MDLFAASWEAVEPWLIALAQVTCFTDIESDYKTVGRLGSGSSSRVYAAIELATGAKVAIKRMGKSQWKGIPERIAKEIEILRRLKGQKGVVALQAVYDDYKDVCLVLRLEVGMSLKAFIGKNIPVPEDQMRIILLNLLTTLAMVHSLHIAHRDIKPDNIIINPAANFTPCMLDFGLSIDQIYLNNGQICGTPGYIAPEILRGEVGNDRMDVYGLGMVGWTMVKGKNPFVAGDRRETLMRNREGRVRGEWWDGMGDQLKDLLERMTSPDPGSRPTVSECLQHPWFSEESLSDPANEKLLSRLSSMDSDFSTVAEDHPPLAANRD